MNESRVKGLPGTDWPSQPKQVRCFMTNNEDNNQDQGNFLFGGRIVPVKREGKIVYARTLRRGEADTGEAIHLGPGDQLAFLPGALAIDSRDIDEYYNPEDHGGYRPVANTVWTWHRFTTEQLGFFLFLFSLARRTDAAHALWALAIQARDKARDDQGIPQRQGHFKALAAAEMAIIALGRCYRMVCGLIKNYCPELQVPDSVTKTLEAVQEMRNAFEHIDERAEGKVRGGKVDPDALTIFDQPDFVEASILRYKAHELNFESDVIAALVDCRALIMDAIDARAKQNAGNKQQEE